MKISNWLAAAICVLTMFAFTGSAQTAKKLSRSEATAAILNKVAPEYPQIARQLKIEGVVELEATLAESGHVETVNVVSGNPVLARPAADALKKWKFAPQTLDGKPVRAMAPVSISFKM